MDLEMGHLPLIIWMGLMEPQWPFLREIQEELERG
jgi:hypothetical protein